MYRSIRVLAALAAALILATTAHAGKVNGKVQDASGAAVAGVMVKLEPAEEGPATLQAKTKKKGNFFFAMVRRGQYVLTAEVEGQRIAEIDVRIEDKDGRTLFEKAGPLQPGEALPVLTIGDTDEVEATLVVAAATGGAGEFGTGTALMGTGEIVDLIQRDKKDKAREELTRGLEVTPDDASLNYLLAYLEMQENNNAAGLEAIERALDIDPTLAGARLLKGTLLEAEGDTEAALAIFREEADVSEDSQVVLNAWIKVAQLAKPAGKDEIFIEAIEAIIELDPANSVAFSQMFDYYAQKGDAEKLVELREAAPPDLIDDPMMHFNIGAALYNAGNPDDAADAFNRVIELDPELPDTYRFLAYCRVGNADYAGAIESLTKYLELAPDAPDRGEVEQLISGLQAQQNK